MDCKYWLDFLQNPTLHRGANPTIASYNATSSLVCLKAKLCFFYFEKMLSTSTKFMSQSYDLWIYK
jgi:hypothetical protein